MPAVMTPNKPGDRKQCNERIERRKKERREGGRDEGMEGGMKEWREGGREEDWKDISKVKFIFNQHYCLCRKI
jgi:predicted adenine nucleotide alpha hydrolase (AANH) superfamily ATPase